MLHSTFTDFNAVTNYLNYTQIAQLQYSDKYTQACTCKFQPQMAWGPKLRHSKYWLIHSSGKRKNTQPQKDKNQLRSDQSVSTEGKGTPVELQHSSSNDHATRNLERHATQHVLQLTGVWVKCGLVQLLGTPDVGICCAARLRLVSKLHYTIPMTFILYYYYYAKVMFAHSYSENSHEHANVKNMLSCIVQSSTSFPSVL